MRFDHVDVAAISARRKGDAKLEIGIRVAARCSGKMLVEQA
jgi:hypothetical protein